MANCGPLLALSDGVNDNDGKPLWNGEEKKESNGSLNDPKEDPKALGIPKLSSNSWNCLCWLSIHSRKSVFWPCPFWPKLELNVISWYFVCVSSCWNRSVSPRELSSFCLALLFQRFFMSCLLASSCVVEYDYNISIHFTLHTCCSVS